LFREWRERRVFESTEQHVCDQARAIRKNGWLSEAELDAIKVQVESEPESQIYREQNDIVETDPVETVIENVEEESADVEHSLDDTEDNICEETGMIVEQLKKIIVEKKSSEGIIFNKVGRMVLKAQVDRVNEAVKYLNSNTIAEINSLVVATSV